MVESSVFINCWGHSQKSIKLQERRVKVLKEKSWTPEYRLEVSLKHETAEKLVRMTDTDIYQWDTVNVKVKVVRFFF